MTDEPLPAIVPIFPLSGVLLLPRTPLPLHIFEPRYRAMTRDALEGHGFIAMVQPNGSDDGSENPPIYPIACLGKIIASENMEDGQINIVLRGQTRLRVVQELTLKDGYRRVEADYSEFQNDVESWIEPIDRDGLLAALKSFLERRNLQANWDDAAKANDESLVNALSAACPFGPQEKQALLEASTVADRAMLLQVLCELDTGENGGRGPMNVH